MTTDNFQRVVFSPDEPITEDKLNTIIQNQQYVWNTANRAPRGLIGRTTHNADITVTASTVSAGEWRDELTDLQVDFSTEAGRLIEVGFSCAYIESTETTAGVDGVLRLAFDFVPNYSGNATVSASELQGRFKSLSFLSEILEDTNEAEHLYKQSGMQVSAMVDFLPAGDYSVKVFGSVNIIGGTTHDGVKIKATGDVTNGDITVWVRDCGSFVPSNITDEQNFVEEVNETQIQ